jgi:integrase
LTKYAKTQRECREWIRATVEKIRGGLTFDGTQVTLGQFIENWLNGKEISRRPRTVFLYRQLTQQYILPALGHMKLQDIQPAHLKQLYVMKRDEGRGARTIQLIHSLLFSVLKQAMKEGILSRNPAEAVDRPRVEQAEFQILTEAQARQFLIAVTGSEFEALFYLALTTSMRQGELLGLKWSDLDWEKGTLLVQRQLQQVENKGYAFVPPKTKAGRRDIKIGDASLNQLASHRERQKEAKAVAGKRWQENNLIFPTTIGTPLDNHRVTREFKSILEKAGLPNIRFHDLRHTSISLLLEMGTPVNTVQRRAGHSKASVTTDIYGHATARGQEQAAQTIEDLVVPVAVKLQSK